MYDIFFYDNPEIAEKYGLVTCMDGVPIGFVTWDPRKRPEYVEIGHNGIREKNNALIRNGRKVISDGALVAITLMIAESRPEEKDIMVALVMNFLTL